MVVSNLNHFLVSQIVLAALVAVTMAQMDAIVTKQDSEVNPDGSYQYAYETSNGIAGTESGNGGISAQGQASWTAPDGTPVQFSYTADETGYHPDNLPVGPEIPPQILKALEYIRAHPPQE